MAESTEEITINFKTTKGAKESVSISKSATVKELKEKIQEKATDLEAERQRVIYKGRVLKDDQTVEGCGLSEGQMVIVVTKKGGAKAKTAPTAQPTATQPTPSTTSSTTAPTASATNTNAQQPNPFAAFMNPNMGGNPQMGGMGNPMMGGMGMNMDPQMMQQMLQNPMMQQMMQQMAQNPAMVQQLIQNNPMLQQMMQQNPQAAAMLQNPQMLQLMFNPNMIQAAMQMQQAMNQTRQMNAQQAQASSSATGTPATASATTGSTDANASAQNPGANQPNPFAAMFGAMNQPPTNQATGAQPQANPFMFNPYMQGMQGFGQPQQPAVEPEILYRNQLAQLNTMGFTDAAANLNALKATGGNVEAAVDRLLQG